MWKAWRRIPKDIDSEKEKQLREEPLEKGDLPAMLLASVITVFLPVLLILAWKPLSVIFNKFPYYYVLLKI